VTLTVLMLMLLLAALWTLVLSVHLGTTLRSRTRRRNRAATAAASRSVIEDALVNYLMGCDDLSRLRALAAANPEQMQESILGFTSAIRGESRDRLCDLLIRLSFIKRWCSEAESQDPIRRRAAYALIANVAHYEPARRLTGSVLVHPLADPDEQVRFHAARALARSEDMEQVACVFRYALRLGLLARLVLAQDLRPQAAALCQSDVPEALRCCPSTELLALLQMLESWECVLPLEDLTVVGSHPDPAIRRQTMRILALAPATPANLGAVERGLDDADPEVRAAAIATSRHYTRCRADQPSAVRAPDEELPPVERLCTSGEG